MWNLERKRAVVTGAASGIGRALAEQLAERTVHLCLVDRQGDLLEEVAEICRGKTVFVQTVCGDLRDRDVQREVDRVVEEAFCGLDLLINNAGIGCYGKTEQVAIDQLREVLRSNLEAPLELTSLLLPHLLEQRRAHIVNMASMYGLFPTQRSTLYHASKYGLVGFSQALRVEYARYGLGVTAVCPGFVRTSLFDQMLRPEGEAGPVPPNWLSTTSEVVARKTIRAIQKNRRLVPITWAAHLGYTLQRFVPGLVDWGYHRERKKVHPRVRQAERRGPVEISRKDLLAPGRDYPSVSFLAQESEPGADGEL